MLPIMSFGQKVTVTADKMNDLYKGCNNPLTVVVENHDCSEVIAKSDNGSLNGSDCIYNYFNSDSTSKWTRIFVGIKKDTLINWVDTLSFRLKNIPLPTVYWGARKGGEVSKNVFLASTLLTLDYWGIDGEFDYYPIKEFSIKIFRKDSLIFENNNIDGCKLTPTITKFVQMSCNTGDIINFHNIIAIGPDKTKSYLNEINLTLK